MLHFYGFKVIYSGILAIVVELVRFILAQLFFSSVLCQLLQSENLISIFSKSQSCIFTAMDKYDYSFVYNSYLVLLLASQLCAKHRNISLSRCKIMVTHVMKLALRKSSSL